MVAAAVSAHLVKRRRPHPRPVAAAQQIAPAARVAATAELVDVVNGTAGSSPSSPSGAGAGATGSNASTSDTQHPAGGGGGGGYAGGGSGTANACTITPSLGGGGGGAGSSWVSTSNLTSFTNGSNPTFTAGSTVNSSACGQQQTDGTSGATTGAGGEAFPTSSGTGGGYAGCPGNVTLTWTALPGAPTGVSCTGGNAQASCSWTAPTDSGTASITSYKVTAVPVPSGTTVSQTFSSTATSETLTGLTNGTSYNLSVAAITTVGTGPAANASNNPVSLGTAPSITSAQLDDLHGRLGRHLHGDLDGHPDGRSVGGRLAAERGDLLRQRQRDRHPGRHAGGRDRRQLPDHHHGQQRHQPERHAVLHTDRRPGPGHHIGQLDDLHGRLRRHLHGDLDGHPDGRSVRGRLASERGDLLRQR